MVLALLSETQLLAVIQGILFLVALFLCWRFGWWFVNLGIPENIHEGQKGMIEEHFPLLLPLTKRFK